MAERASCPWSCWTWPSRVRRGGSPAGTSTPRPRPSCSPSPLERGLLFRLPWPDGPPRHERLHLFARYETADGRRLEAQREITVHRSAGTRLAAPSVRIGRRAGCRYGPAAFAAYADHRACRGESSATLPDRAAATTATAPPGPLPRPPPAASGSYAGVTAW